MKGLSNFDVLGTLVVENICMTYSAKVCETIPNCAKVCQAVPNCARLGKFQTE